jgi:hypothetical protein
MEGWQGRPFGTWWGHGLLCWQVHVFATNCAEDRRKYHGGHAGNREQILARILWNYGELMWNPKQKPLEIKRVTQYNLVIEKTFEDPWESVKSQVLLFSFLGSRHRLFWLFSRITASGPRRSQGSQHSSWWRGCTYWMTCPGWTPCYLEHPGTQLWPLMSNPDFV